MRYRLRAPAATLIVAAFFSVGVVGLQASPTCQRLARKYSEKVARHVPSKETLARWAAWGKDHPNYHAPAKPRPRLTPQETYDKVNFACEVPTAPVLMAFNLDPVPLGQIEVPSVLVPEETTTPAFSLVGVPPEVAPAPTDEPVPEPASLILFGTALALLLLWQKPLHIGRRRGTIALS